MLVDKNLFNQLLNLAVEGIEYQNEKWITVHPHGDDSKGVHLKVEDGETNKQAIDRKFGGKDKKEWNIDLNKLDNFNKYKYEDQEKIFKIIKQPFEEKASSIRINWGSKEIQLWDDNKHGYISEKIKNGKIGAAAKVLYNKYVKNIKAEHVLNFSIKLVEKNGTGLPKTRTITAKIKNPDESRLKDYKALFKKQVLKENPNFRVHGSIYSEFEYKKV